MTRAKAVVKRQRVSGDELGPILELQDQCDEAERERKKALYDLHMHTVYWKFEVHEARKNRDDVRNDVWSKFKAEEAARKEAEAARKEAEAKLANARKPTWLLPPMQLEFNQPASNPSHNAANHNHTFAHPQSNEYSDDEANADEYTWYDYYMDEGYTADQSRDWAEWRSNNDNRHNYIINDITYNDAASNDGDSGICSHNNSDSFGNASAYTR